LEEVGGSGLDGFEIGSQLFSQIKMSATFVKKTFTSKQISDVPLIPTVFGFVGFTFYKLRSGSYRSAPAMPFRRTM
jgi:hypothetical protein